MNRQCLGSITGLGNFHMGMTKEKKKKRKAKRKKKKTPNKEPI